MGTANKINELDMLKMGPTLTVTLPSGKIVTIREQTGEDEDTISRVKDNKDGTALHKFLAGLIVDPMGITYNDIAKWRVRDKYYLILKSRIHSLGNEVSWDYTFQNGGDTYPITENLEIFDWDFSKGAPPRKFEDNYNPNVCQSYKDDSKEVTPFEYASGKFCKYEYLTGLHEKATLDMDEGNLAIGDRLRLRNFQLKLGDSNWVKVDRFNMISSKEMIAIRAHLETWDPEFTLMTTIKHPTKNITERISILGVEDFFFPKA